MVANWNAVVAMPPGRYMVTANSAHCSGGFENWVAIPGAQRRLALTINKRKVGTIGGESFGLVYGFLPSSVARVEVMRADGVLGEQTRRTAQIDGDTYEVQNLYPGPYVVRVSFGNVIASREVVVGRTYDGLTVRADLTTDEAASIVRQQASGSHFVHVPNYQNVVAVSFRLGAASAGGWVTEPLTLPSDYATNVQRISALTAGALASVQRFLAGDSQIPQTFKSLAAWSVNVLNDTTSDVTIDLKPVDIAAWQKQAPNTRYQCQVFAGDDYVRLTIDSQTWKVDQSKICP